VTKRNLAIPVGVLLLSVFAGPNAPPAAAQSQQPPTVAVANFESAINDYSRMHRRLEKLVGEITINSSVASINRSMQALAAAIRVERSNAQQGDLFTPALARELRTRVNDALLEHGFTPDDVLAGEQADRLEPRVFRLRVNDTFPWILASAMFPCVIDALPPLPSELQYRIVRRDLLLIDVHASLVVDILPDVLIDTTDPYERGNIREP